MMRNVRRVLLPIFAVGALFFVMLLGVAFVRTGFQIFSRPGFFLADIKSAAQGFFGSSQKTLLEIPETSETGKPQTDLCSYETLTQKKLTGVVMNEIAWMGTEENYNAEWIELKNIAANPEDISLWQLIDADEKIHAVIPQGTTLAPGDFYLLTRTVKNGALAGDLSYGGSLRNTGTGLRLFNSACELEDEIPQGAWPAGENETKQTMARNARGGWATSMVRGGTPRAENGAVIEKKSAGITKTTPPQKVADISETTPLHKVTSSTVTEKTFQKIIVSEVYPGSATDNNDEFLELFNPHNFSVSLAGWSIKKRTGTGSVSALVAASRLEGKTIPANGFFLIGREAFYRGTVPPDVLWAKSNSIAAQNNTILLFDANGNEVDMLGWTAIPKGESLLRSATGNEVRVGVPSPKSENNFSIK